MKLQEAYASENNAVGTWAAIGYKGPGSQASNSSVSSTFTYGQGSDGAGTWEAKNKVALNDCQANQTWSITSSYASGDVTTAVDNDDLNNCVTPLTPNFCKIATTGKCTSES